MAVNESDSLQGRVVQTGRPKNVSWGKPLDFIKLLTEILKVEFPVRKNNKFVLVGKQTPDSEDTDTLWAKIDSTRNPLGWHIFLKGQWRKFHTPLVGEIRWIIGDSTNIEKGWQLIDDGAGGITSNVINQLKNNYIENLSVPGTYVYFAVRFIGY